MKRLKWCIAGVILALVFFAAACANSAPPPASEIVAGEKGYTLTLSETEIAGFTDTETYLPVPTAKDGTGADVTDRVKVEVLYADGREQSPAHRYSLYNAFVANESGNYIAAYSVENSGGIILVKDMEEACALANEIAPEHLELACENCEALLPRIRSAGAVFMGGSTPEPVGDYFAGPDHTLPTGGTARFFEVLNQDIFLRKMSVIRYTEAALAEDAADIVRLAENEGLHAHANAVRIRTEKEKRK